MKSGKRKKVSSTSIIVGFILSAVSILGFLVLYRSITGSSRENLPIAQVRENPKSFSGNGYDLEASIESQIAYKENVGRIILTKDLMTGIVVPIFVPDSLSGFNPSPSQLYRFSLKIDHAGVLNLTNFKKL